ncbi:MAG: LLM class flavin-dependent oxidoreductase [Candidatus Tectomicrobia bacterium]|uniref:LLM class flavin-dependent oxidoreductase n=1 Tax=Tectimicrobiota bacterium TaxID=2528274 RepID=A0A937VXL9_UNCTE|nr:LLM class flavin-dependent oxidoreductase [Candidatus Tectomicrobia bacterium]
MAYAGISVGLLLPTREVVMAQGAPDLSKIIDLAVRAEELGFDSVWVGDSILARPRLEALTTLAAVASRTQRVKLGTAVLLPALRQPVVLANEAANVDLLSHGRLILGVGVASKNPPIEREFAACGVSFAHRLGIFEECITLLRRLWTEPAVTHQGRHFQLQDVRLGLRPVQTAGIPLWLAGSVENAQRRVIRLGDGWFPNPRSPAFFATQWEHIQGYARQMGREVQHLPRCVYTTLNINSDVSQAQREVQTFMEGYYDAPYEVLSRQQGACAGTAEHCAAWLNAFVAGGAQTLVVRFGGPDQFGQLERCVKDVLPQLHTP